MKRFFIFALVLLAVTVGNWFWGNYVVLGGRVYPRDAAVLVLPEGVNGEALSRFTRLYWVDLRGTGLTGAEYEAISQAAGGAEILWELSFQGGRLNPNTREIQIDHLTAEDGAALDYLPRLELVGDGELRMENHKGILAYGTEEIHVSGGAFVVKITGHDLELRAMTGLELLVTGRITQIQLG